MSSADLDQDTAAHHPAHGRRWTTADRGRGTRRRPPRVATRGHPAGRGGPDRPRAVHRAAAARRDHGRRAAPDPARGSAAARHRHHPRNELVRRAREWRRQLRLTEQAAPSQRRGQARTAGADPAEVLEPGRGRRDSLSPASADNGRRDRSHAAGRSACLMPRGIRRRSAAWAPSAGDRAHDRAAAGYVTDLLARLRERWTKSCPGRDRCLRVDVRGHPRNEHGRVLEAPDRRRAARRARLRAGRRCRAGSPWPQACLPAAIDTETPGEPAAGQPRRMRRPVLVASVPQATRRPREDDLFDYARRARRTADQLALSRTDPLPSVTARSAELPGRPAPPGMPCWPTPTWSPWPPPRRRTPR